MTEGADRGPARDEPGEPAPGRDEPRGLTRRHFLGGASAAGALAMGAGVLASACSAEAPAGAQGAPTVPATVPAPRPSTARGGNGMNCVIIVIDTLRPDHLGAYGSTRVATPSLDAFASTSVRFTRAAPEAMPTILARRAIHTGRRTYPARDWVQLSDSAPLAGWAPIPNDESTLAELLAQVGYTNVLLADNPMVFSSWMNFQRGYASFEWTRGQAYDRYRPIELVPPAAAAPYLFPEQRQGPDAQTVRQYLANLRDATTAAEWPAAQLFGRGVQVLDELSSAQPFLLVLDTFEAHEPWLPPPEYRSLGADGYTGIEPIQPHYGSASYLTEAALGRTQALYAGEVMFTDAMVGMFLDGLAARGLDDRTLVIVMSDHGILLGEHGLVGKPSRSPYPEVTDIVLMARHPTGPRPGVVDLRAGTHDVTPTVLAALGVDVDAPLDGTDLLSAASAAAHRTHQTSLFGDTLWVSDDRWLLIGERYGRTPHLFDMVADPALRNDLARSRGAEVRRLLKVARADAGGPIPRYPPPPI